MDYNNRERVVHKAGDADGCTGGWVCSKCKAPIETLPFPPDPARMDRLLCNDCWRAERRGSFNG